MAEPKTPTSLLYRIFSLKSELSKINEAVQKGRVASLYPHVGRRDLSAHLDREVAGREEELRRLEAGSRGARGYSPKSDYQYLFVRYREDPKDKNIPELLFEPPAKKGARDPNQDVWRELVAGGLVDQRGKLLFQPQLYKEARDEASALGKDEVARRYFERVERLARRQVQQDLAPLLSQELLHRDLTSRLAQRTYENLAWNLPVAPWSSSLSSLRNASWEIARGYLEETEVHRVASQAYYGQPEATGSIMRLKAARRSAVKAAESAAQGLSSRSALDKLIGGALEKALGDNLAPDVWQSVRGVLPNSVLTVLGQETVPDSVPEFSLAVQEGALDLVRRDVSVHGEVASSYYLAPLDVGVGIRAAGEEAERIEWAAREAGATIGVAAKYQGWLKTFKSGHPKWVFWLISPRLADALYPKPLKSRILPKWARDLEKTGTPAGMRKVVEGKLWAVFKNFVGVPLGIFVRQRDEEGEYVPWRKKPKVVFRPFAAFSRWLRGRKGKFAEKFLLGGLTGNQRLWRKKKEQDTHLPVLLAGTLFKKGILPLVFKFLAGVDKYILGGRAAKYWGLTKGWVQTKWFVLEQSGTFLGKLAQSLRVGSQFFGALVGGWKGGAGFGIIGYFLSGGNPLVTYLAGGVGWAAKSLSILASSQSFLGLATQNFGPISSLARFLAKFRIPLAGGKFTTFFKLPIKGPLAGFGIGYVLGGPVGGAIGGGIGFVLDWVWSTRVAWLAKLGAGLGKVPLFAKLTSRWAALKNFLAPIFKIFGLPGKILGWIFSNTFGGPGFWMGLLLGDYLGLPFLQRLLLAVVGQGGWLGAIHLLAPTMAGPLAGWSFLGLGVGQVLGLVFHLPAPVTALLSIGLQIVFPIGAGIVIKFGFGVIVGAVGNALTTFFASLAASIASVTLLSILSAIGALVYVMISVGLVMLLIGTAWSMFTWPQHLPIQPSDKITISKTVDRSSLSLNSSVRDVIFTIGITNVSDEPVEIEEFTDLLNYTAPCGVSPSGFEYGSPTWDKSAGGYGVIFFDRNGDERFTDDERWEDSMTDMRGFPYGFAGASDWPAILPGQTHSLKIKLVGMKVDQDGSYTNELIIRAVGEPTYQKSTDFLEVKVGVGGCFEGPRGWPTAGCITQGPRTPGHTHAAAEAIDIGLRLDNSAGIGEPIKSTLPGAVELVCRVGDGDPCDWHYGNYVEVRKPQAHYRVRFAHLHTIAVREGEPVGRGQVVGTKGNTGNSTGPHLHYEFVRVVGTHTETMAPPRIPQAVPPCVGVNSGPCQPTICF